MLRNSPMRHTLEVSVDKSMQTTASIIASWWMESSLSHPSFDQAGGSGRPIPSHFLLRNGQCGHDFYLKSAQYLHNNNENCTSFHTTWSSSFIPINVSDKPIHRQHQRSIRPPTNRKRTIKGKNHHPNRTDSIETKPSRPSSILLLRLFTTRNHPDHTRFCDRTIYK